MVLAPLVFQVNSFCHVLFSILFLSLLKPLTAGDEDHLGEGDQHGKYEPGLDPFDVGSLFQFLYNTDQEGGGGQHHRQVYCDRRVEEVRQPEVRCCIADSDQ